MGITSICVYDVTPGSCVYSFSSSDEMIIFSTIYSHSLQRCPSPLTSNKATEPEQVTPEEEFQFCINSLCFKFSGSSFYFKMCLFNPLRVFSKFPWNKPNQESFSVNYTGLFLRAEFGSSCRYKQTL